MTTTPLAPSRLTLRAAVPDDVEIVAAVWHQGWRDGHLGHVPAELRARRQRNDFRRRVPEILDLTTVAVVESRVVGFVTVHNDEIEQIYVAAAARGNGTAVALLTHGERLIGERFDLAWLAVVAGNARARRFYARRGWCDAGPIDYTAHAREGTITVAARRYEKRIR
jgi:ribosomal protein S18 acetylase RimI-like enzyme